MEGGLDWIQPDPGRCGISVFVEAGRMACRHRRMVVNHSFKSGINIAASLHALSAVPNTEVFEFCMADSPLRHDLTNERFEIEDGYVRLPGGRPKFRRIWEVALCVTIWNDVISIGCLELTRFVRKNRRIRAAKTDLAGLRRQYSGEKRPSKHFLILQAARIWRRCSSKASRLAMSHRL